MGCEADAHILQIVHACRTGVHVQRSACSSPHGRDAYQEDTTQRGQSTSTRRPIFLSHQRLCQLGWYRHISLALRGTFVSA